MKAPEKLYCMHRLSGDYSCSTTPFAGGDEYIRKDAFIEKACEWLKDNITYIHPRKGTKECIVNLTRFKNYMKGE